MANTPTELTSYPLYDENENDPDVIRSQIARTRAQMSETVDQIQARLAPDQLKQQAQEAIREATLGKVEEMTMNVERKARNWRSGLMHTIRENPIPSALVGIGLGWLMMSNKNGNDYAYYQESDGRQYNGGSGYRPSYTHYPQAQWQEPGRVESARMRAGEAVDTAQERVGEAVGTAQARVGEAVGTAQARVGEMVDQVQERSGELAHDVRSQVQHTAENVSEQASNLTEQARARAEEMRFQTRMGVYRAKRTFSDTLQENPMAVGVAALAAGALIGLVLPSTPVEDQWLGETRDRVVEEAKDVAKDTAERVQHVAQKAQRAAVDEAKQVAEEEGLTSTQDSTSTFNTTDINTESWSSS
jgi:ElaB/YqjD/DUF883 family membrane-anchored ribosome-binding protein